MIKTIPSLLILCCFSATYAGYENGGVITTYVGDVTCQSGLLEVRNGGAADLLEILNSSQIKIWSTSPLGYMGGIWDIVLGGHSHLDYYCGDTDELSIRNYSTAKLYGGQIAFISSFQTVTDIFVGYDEQGNPIFDKLRHIEMFVRDYDYNSTTNRVTGTWEDWTTFDIKLLDQDPTRYSPAIANIEFTIIPEPATMLLLAFGGFMLRKRTAN